jgi:hypothetical protein
MTRTIRPLVVAAALVALASVAIGSASGARSHGTIRFEAQFQESNVLVTNRIADLGIFQLINTGTGTVDEFGPATMVLAMSQDRSVTPCGPGSWTNAGLRRIVVAAGVLILRNRAYVCQTAAGPVATGTWRVDGDASTGMFAGARGTGTESVHIPTARSTLSGKVKLRHGDGGADG